MYTKVGLKIKQIRKENKDSLKTLAAKLDHDWSNLGKMERGERAIPISLLVKIGEIYDVKASYFFEGFTESEGELLDDSDNMELKEVKEKYDFVRNMDTPVTDDEIIEAILLIRYLRQK